MSTPTSIRERADNSPVIESLDFDQLYNAYFSRVYNYVYYRVNNVYDAEDLTSQIFTKLFVKLKYYQPEKAPLSVWIFTIVRNTLTDYYRARVRNVCISLEETAELIDRGDSPAQAAESAEIRRYLQQALSALNCQEREIIALKFWSGFSNREIALLIGISESNTGVIIFRAMRRLRQILESQGMNIDDGKK